MAVSLKKRVQFYHTLATMEEAGVSLLQALDQRHPGPFREAAQHLRSRLQVDGLQLSEAMRLENKLFSPMEYSLVSVGEHTGHLDVVFASLADWFGVLSRLRSQMISGLIYPALTYHFAAVAIPFISIFTANTPVCSAVLRACVLLSLPWLAIFLGKVFSGVPRIPALSWFFLQIPLVGGFLLRLDCTRFFHAYSLCLRAGVPVTRAIRLSGTCCRNALMRRRFEEIEDAVTTEGITFTEAFMRVMPPFGNREMIEALMHTGEQTGRADESAARIARVFQEDTETLLQRIGAVLPTLIYLALAVYIGITILRFYGQLLAPVRDLLD